MQVQVATLPRHNRHMLKETKIEDLVGSVVDINKEGIHNSKATGVTSKGDIHHNKGDTTNNNNNQCMFSSSSNVMGAGRKLV